MQAKILCIQFRKDPHSIEREQAAIQREAGVYAEINFISAMDDARSWDKPAEIMAEYQGLILGGSGELYFDGKRAEKDPNRVMSYQLLDKLRSFFSYVFEHDLPTLGICYGHQLLGAFAGAQVCCDDKQGKTCSHEVKLMVNKHNHFLFSDLPESFQAHYGHKDSLDRVPEGAVLLMNGGDQCKVSALQYKNNIYTTQFHPELNFDDMVDRMKNSSGYLPEGTVVEEIFKNDPHSNTILQNFGKFVAMKAEKAK